MITLITGAPGSGKSAALVDLLIDVARSGRVIYAHGVPDLRVEHVPLGDPHDWHRSVPDGAAVVIDEVQNVWRPRGPSQKAPEHVTALETHRHRGLDFFIVTQQPKLLDTNVRALVGRHVHLRDVGILGRHWYEWPECCESVTTAWKTCALKKRYKLPKRVFSLYKSASVHVKPIRSIPPALIVAVVAVLGFAVAATMAVRGVKARMDASKSTDTTAPVQQSPGIVRPLLTRSASDPREPFIPRLPSDPGTAPAYDHLRRVVVAPRVIGGFCRAGKCRCFTQQGTDAGIGDASCAAWIASPPFDPYREPQRNQQPEAAIPQQAAASAPLEARL